MSPPSSRLPPKDAPPENHSTETIELVIEGDASLPYASFVADTAVVGDWKEAALIRKICSLSDQHEVNFHRALKADTPNAMRDELKTVVARLELEMGYIKELSLYRHGEEQIHEVKYFIGGEECELTPQNDLEVSDNLIEELFLHAVENLESFSSQCVKRKKYLSSYRLPSFQRGWPTGFQRLETYIFRQCAKFRSGALKVRNKRKQTHKVKYSGTIPASKVAAIKKMRVANDTAKSSAVQYKSSEFPIGAGIPKACKHS